jgi:SAM-dependent methyltransferase
MTVHPTTLDLDALTAQRGALEEVLSPDERARVARLLPAPGPHATAVACAIMTNEFHEANRRRWDAGAAQWARRADSREIWRRCPAEPELMFSPAELRHLGDLDGRRVCVLGSGDNQAVFALAGLGAHVTSVDISEKQLEVARRRADELGLAVEFLRADVTDLGALDDETFDVVYTGGHVAVWVSDLETYYAEAGRILRQDGLLLVVEYHPFRRVWRLGIGRLEVGAPYFERGPYVHDLNEDILEPEPGPMKSYEFHWTVSDHVRAVLGAGCRVIDVGEFGEDVGDWEGGPFHGLPEHLMVAGRKAGGA